MGSKLLRERHEHCKHTEKQPRHKGIAIVHGFSYDTILKNVLYLYRTLYYIAKEVELWIRRPT